MDGSISFVFIFYVVSDTVLFVCRNSILQLFEKDCNVRASQMSQNVNQNLKK